MAKRIIWRGKVFNQRTVDMIKRAEARLGHELHIMQGSYNAGRVGASAGTHDGGGAVDFGAPSNPDNAVLQLRKSGFAAWYRPALPGVWPRHIHAIAIGDEDLSSGAKNQVWQYYNRQNGLANHGPDNGPRLDPIPVWYVPLPKAHLLSAIWQFKRPNPKKALITERIQRLLNYRMGTHLLVDGVAGPKTKAAYKAWEKKIDAPRADGRPGGYSLRKLFAGFYRVVR